MNKNIKFNKKETELKMENPIQNSRERTFGFSSHKNCKLKVKL